MRIRRVNCDGSESLFITHPFLECEYDFRIRTVPNLVILIKQISENNINLQSRAQQMGLRSYRDFSLRRKEKKYKGKNNKIFPLK